jgi:hypothetical protein
MILLACPHDANIFPWSRIRPSSRRQEPTKYLLREIGRLVAGAVILTKIVQNSSGLGLYKPSLRITPRNTQIVRGRSNRIWCGINGVQREAGRAGERDPGK